jgi:hypothetical protein
LYLPADNYRTVSPAVDEWRISLSASIANGSAMSSSAPDRQRNGRHRLTAHYDRDTHDLGVLIRGANEELFTDLTVHESKVPYFQAAGQA